MMIKKIITEIKPFDLENLIKWKVVQGVMIPKIQNCVDAVKRSEVLLYLMEETTFNTT